MALLPLFYLIARATSGVPDGWLSASTVSALWGSVRIALLVSVVCVAVALPLAWLTHSTDLPGRRLFRVLLVLPLAVPSYVGGYLVVAAFAPGGLWPLFSPYSTLGAVLALTFTYPFAYLAIQASLDRSDPRLWESARSLGCSPARAFFKVVLPQLRMPMAGGGLLVGLYAIGDFGAVSLTRYESLSYLIYLRHKSLFHREEAIPLALLLIAVSAAIAAIFLRLGGRQRAELRAQRRAWPTIALGRYRWPSFVACSLIVTAGVLAPAAIVVRWWIRGQSRGTAGPLPIGEAGNTLWIGVAAALIICALALVPALVRRFGHSAMGTLMRLATYAGYALPGIVVALAMVSLATSWAHPLYQTFPLLILAYAIRFTPLALTTLDDSLSSQSPALYWAARSLGATPRGALWRVVLPAARSGVVVALLAVFIAVIKELPVTLLLGPIEFATLATRIWALTEDAYFAAAAPAVLLLLVLAAVALVLSPDVRRRA